VLPLAIEQHRHGDVRERPNRKHDDLARVFVDELDQSLRRRQRIRLTGRHGRQHIPPESLRVRVVAAAVEKTSPGSRIGEQRPIGTTVDRDSRGCGRPEDFDSALHSLVDGDVARDHRDGQQLDFRRVQRERDCEGVIDIGAGDAVTRVCVDDQADALLSPIARRLHTGQAPCVSGMTQGRTVGPMEDGLRTLRTRAVVFDLFETLVDYDEGRSRAFSAAAAELLGRDADTFHALWRKGRPMRDAGPMRTYLSSIGIVGDDAERVIELRRAFSLRLLTSPRDGVVETLRELRRRKIRTGLITMCSEDVVDVWEKTPFSGLFETEVFSCSCGYLKPDPRLYLQACEQLDVDPVEALYVGDGSNDELAGAERVGMRAVLVHRAGEEPPWPEVREWPGVKITSIPEVLLHL
jgi:putative hydrolase of the HAD superfamily